MLYERAKAIALRINICFGVYERVSLIHLFGLPW